MAERRTRADRTDPREEALVTTFISLNDAMFLLGVPFARDFSGPVRKPSGFPVVIHLKGSPLLFFMRLYLDTNVIMDFLLNRHQPSTDLILRSIACAHELFVSDWTFAELRQQGLATETQWFVAFCGRKLSTIIATQEDMTFARTLATHSQDALHYALARSCDALVTRNVRDFPFPRVLTPRDVT